ncbi:ornithine carbamoyltransferase [candidate division WOR-3 bacterium]|nr:ornithine carbamoyltransferase [candidate division WOR-3 bacterium]
MKKDFVSIKDLSKKEVEKLFLLAEKLKQTRPRYEKPLQDKTIALVFEKPSLRTRVTFETGIYELGGKSIYLSPQDIGLGKRESISDVARNLSLWVSGIVARVFTHQSVIELAEYASIPVINALSDLEHPCQAIADLFTVYEKFKAFKGLKFAYIGDGNNVCRSLMLLAETCGLEMFVATPKGYEPNRSSQLTTCNSQLLNDPKKAISNADVVYTDVWASMGEEAEKEKRLKIFKDFQVNSELLKYAKPECLIMHCLPAHRGEEITSEVLDSKNSIVFQQAENRLHVQKALLTILLSSP